MVLILCAREHSSMSVVISEQDVTDSLSLAASQGWGWRRSVATPHLSIKIRISCAGDKLSRRSTREAQPVKVVCGCIY